VPTRRQQRINERLLEEIALLVPGQFDDPRLAGVRVTRVETTRDLSTAKVYFVLLDDEASFTEAAAALEHAAGRLCTELGAIGLRRLPRLVFAADRAFEQGERVLWLLDHMEADATACGDGRGRDVLSSDDPAPAPE
jgi:ribosome-binding factor A